MKDPKSDVFESNRFFGPAASVAVDSVRVSVTASEGPMSGGALGWLLSHVKTAPL